jgi:hypothetical protein
VLTTRAAIPHYLFDCVAHRLRRPGVLGCVAQDGRVLRDQRTDLIMIVVFDRGEESLVLWP